MVKRTYAERHARGFSRWSQFVAMLFCQLGRAHSLREICGGLASCEGKLSHLGIRAAPSRSTLAYANEHRPWQLYRAVSVGRVSYRKGSTPYCARRASSLCRSSTPVDPVATSNGWPYVSSVCEYSKS